MKQLIIFDCDGVLVDSETIGCQVDAKALTEFGHPITTEEFIKRYTGLSDRTMAQRVKEETGIILPDKYLEDRLHLILDAFETKLQALIDPILTKLQPLQINLCVASGSARARVLKSLEITQQLKYFTNENIFTAQQVENGKPAPDLFLFAAEQMGAAPQDCLVIEDSVAGIQAAQAAKMEVVGFLGGTHAGYEWYQDPVKSFGIPIADTIEELDQLIHGYLK